MRAVTVAEMREFDRITIEEVGVAGEVLMERAGVEVARVASEIASASGGVSPDVLIFAGRGNNGGDAFVAARLLDEMGFGVEVVFAGDVSSIKGDALTHFNALDETDVEIREISDVEEFVGIRDRVRFDGSLLIDGLLGTGISGPARGVIAGAIELINAYSEYAPVLAIDVPSGLNADSGVAEGSVVFADVTVTLAAPKCGLLQPCALEAVGNLEVVDIGIAVDVEDSPADAVELITESDVFGIMKRRARTSHKGSYGHVLLIGGAPGYSGAIAMAAMAALRSGVGLVSVLVPESIVGIVAGLVPEAMVHGGAVNDSGSLAGDALGELLQGDKVAGVHGCHGSGLDSVGESAPRIASPSHGCLGSGECSGYSAVLVGPGMTVHGDGVEIVRTVLASSVGTVVLDADALNIVAVETELLTGGRSGVILTPHPGEMARLLGLDTAIVQSDRFGMARDAAARFGATVVLKGAGTVVVQAGEMLHVNLTGNPGMAVGGMGDVLAGLMAGIAAQGVAVFDAACASVYIHGRAGDFVSQVRSQAGMTARDVVGMLPYVLKDVVGR